MLIFHLLANDRQNLQMSQLGCRLRDELRFISRKRPGFIQHPDSNDLDLATSQGSQDSVGPRVASRNTRHWVC
jgi:hypothetical protein